jgi:hypothetical protein
MLRPWMLYRLTVFGALTRKIYVVNDVDTASTMRRNARNKQQDILFYSSYVWLAGCAA